MIIDNIDNSSDCSQSTDTAMDLTSDEKLVASAMAGWKRPRQDSPMNTSTSNSTSTASPVLAAIAIQKQSPSLNGNGDGIGINIGIEPREKVAKTCHDHSHIPVPIAPMPQAANNNVAYSSSMMQNQNTHMASASASSQGQGLAQLQLPYHVSAASFSLAANAAAPHGQPLGQGQPLATSYAHAQSINAAALHSFNSNFANGIASQSAQGYNHNHNPIKIDEDESTDTPRELKPAPYFYYRDFSQAPDDDPLTPLTPLARLPNFPAKMHAILSRADLADVVTWLPHGRSWKVLKPREFEIRVIPAYFEHSKFSSFIRQANGWGFRRITRGQDRNSYYHESFLRGLPHLCKMMKRPGVSKKLTLDAGHEPDFYTISQEHPVPEKMENTDSIMLPNSLLGRPNARMPVGMRNPTKPLNVNLNRLPAQTQFCQGQVPQGYAVPQMQMHNMARAQNPNPAQFVQMQMNVNRTSNFSAPVLPQSALQTPPSSVSVVPILPKPAAPATATPIAPARYHAQIQPQPHESSGLQAQTQVKVQVQPHHQQQLQAHVKSQASSTLNSPQAQGQFQQPLLTNQQAAAFQQALSAAAAAIGSDPTSQFAAGFAAAAALSNPHFQRVFNQALAQNNCTPLPSNASGTGTGTANTSSASTNASL